MEKEDAGTGMLPYLETTEPHYGQQAADSFAAERLQAGVIMLHGRCPRCGASIAIPIFERVYRMNRRGAAAGQKAIQQHTVMCMCHDHHPNRPDGQVGCGAYWTLEVSEDQP